MAQPQTIYTLYTEAGIFLDPAANILCNRFVTHATTIPETLTRSVLLTGTPAKIIQNQAEPSEVECIPFITNNLDLFRHYQKTIHQVVEVESSRFYKQVLQIKTPVAALELWFFDMELYIIDLGVFSQEAGQIPEEIK